jgi:cytochrome c oxidase subunit 4
MVGHTVEEIRKETRVYLMVFVALAALTAITVGVSYLHLAGWRAIALALIIACIKGFLVAGFFMHLLSEKKLIYSVLIVTLLFFAMLMWIPHAEAHSVKKDVKHVTQDISHGVH